MKVHPSEIMKLKRKVVDSILEGKIGQVLKKRRGRRLTWLLLHNVLRAKGETLP